MMKHLWILKVKQTNRKATYKVYTKYIHGKVTCKVYMKKEQPDLWHRGLELDQWCYGPAPDGLEHPSCWDYLANCPAKC